MRWTLTFPLLVAAAVLFGGPVVEGAEPGKKEAEGRKAAAAELIGFARWCAENGARDAGAKALAEARELDAAAEGLGEVEAAVGAAGTGADEAVLAKGRKTHGARIAKAFDKVAGAKHAEEDAARFDGYRLSALRWDPSAARVKKAIGWAKKEKDADRAGFLLSRARAAAGEAHRAAFDAVAVSMAGKGPLLIGSAEHELVGWVFLPKSWKKGRSYPVLIGVDGAGANHKGYGQASAASRGSRDVIVLAPATLSNTNALVPAKYRFYGAETLKADVAARFAFDGPGVDALLKEVALLFGGEEKVFLTGFSGGGNYTYYKLLQDPAHVRGAVPCCANFTGVGKNGAPGAGDGGGPPVLLLTGENDQHRDFTHGDKNSPGIEPQTDHAEKTLKELGYTHVERRMVKAGHSPLHAEVWKFVDGVLDEK